MRVKSLFILIFFSASTVFSLAQDPIKVAPESYRVQFENDLVRVLRVHYAVRSKVPVHDHSRYPAAYVYLNDAGPVRFSHTDWEHPVLTRPPVKARSFRLSPTTADAETHSVENSGDSSSDFLRIEFKSLKQGRDLAHRRFPPELISVGKAFNKIHFENDHVRVSCLVSAGSSLALPAEHEPSLIAVISPAGITGEALQGPAAKPGQTVWIKGGERATLESADGRQLEVLRFEIKKR
ncbi:MAG: hypothetical protein ABR530_10395 [Pyrinomonadaceae bacterium]